jgi:two-component system, chemotaxis family, chemotaxis protein CheY
VKLRILIVEDSPAMRHLLNMALKRAADVAEAPDGLEALKLLAQQRYDLVFVDLNMPVLDGMKLIKRVREDPSLNDTRICVVTTESSKATEEQARALGADFFLRKPIHRRDVERVLAEAFPG